MPTVDDFKQKYAPVFALMEKGGVRLDHLHVQDDKLVMTGAAASEDLRNAIWNEIKGVDATYSDVEVQIDVDTSLPAPPPDAPAAQSYTVVSGDTLSKIAKHFYGDANAYQKIADANGIDDPNRIQVGQELTIPA
jgi:nucleoid-associated protein YgaU